MSEKIYKKTPLAAAISLALASGHVYAQDTAAKDAQSVTQMEEIVVTGIRQSLKRSMDLKRNMKGVVDAITAEDIGEFPDSNLAESMQRITGVSIDRERGEGSRVTVRGFGPDFNLVLLNGRQMPTNSGLGRSFDFGNLASEGISAVEIYKSARADVPTGGIGSTINIKTTRPLDDPGLKATGAVSAMIDQSRWLGEKTTPEISGLISDTFNDNKVGVALSVVRQERKSGANTASVGGWRTFPGEVDNCWCGAGPSEWGGIPPAGDPNQVNRPGAGDLYSVPQTIGYEIASYDRTRTNGQATLQFRPADNMTATLDYTYAEEEVSRVYTNLSAWFNFAGQETVWTDGPQATPLTYTENSSGSDFAMGAGQDAFVSNLKSAGFNFDWDVNDNLKVVFDYHSSTSKRKPDSPYGDSALVGLATFTRDKTTGYFGQDLPILELGLSHPLSKDDMQVQGSVFTNNLSKMDIHQSRLSATYAFYDSFVDSVDFGVELTEVNNRSAGSVVQRDAWGNGVVMPSGEISDLLTDASIAGAFSDVPGGNDPRMQTQYYTFSMPAIIDRTEQLMASGDANVFQLSDMGDCGTGLCPSSTFSSDRRTQEDSKAFYVQANMSTELANKPVSMRLGMRYETTDVSSQALSPTYTAITWGSGNELHAVGGGAPAFTELTGDYHVFLPNFDFKMDITDQIVGRFSASKSITRPNYGDIQGGETIDTLVRIDGGTGNRGNPALKPIESTNLDLSFEYYYGESSYLAVGYFHKDVKNFIGTSSVTENTFDLPDPALGPLVDQARAATGSSDGGTLYNWIITNLPNAEGVDAANGVITGVAGRDPAAPFKLTVPVNIDKASMKGWELVVQHNFWDTGFGVIANATFVNSDVGYDNFSLEQQFVLTGLSNSANLVAFYDKNNLSVRLAYNWRDEFLSGTGQANVGAGPPTYVGPYKQLDLSANYWFNDHLQVFLDGINITNSTTHVYGRSPLQTLFASQLGPRYNLGVRYKF